MRLGTNELREGEGECESSNEDGKDEEKKGKSPAAQFPNTVSAVTDYIGQRMEIKRVSDQSETQAPSKALN